MSYRCVHDYLLPNHWLVGQENAVMKMRAHCRKLASLVEHHESRANAAEKSLALINLQRKKAARQSEEYVEFVRVPRRGKVVEFSGRS